MCAEPDFAGARNAAASSPFHGVLSEAVPESLLDGEALLPELDVQHDLSDVWDYLSKH